MNPQKTIVCIASDDMTLNYLFVKEMHTPNCAVLLIATHTQNDTATHFLGLFPGIPLEILTIPQCPTDDLWNMCCRTISRELVDRHQYHVNLSGGTRMLSIAVQQVFSRYNSQFYFMPIDRNVIIHSFIDHDPATLDKVHPISHRLSISEYLHINSIESRHKKPTQSFDYTQHFFTLFTQNHLSDKDHDLLDDLRKDRDSYLVVDSVPGLSGFLEHIGFEQSQPDKLTPKEIQFLTGNWFEEYIYYVLCQQITPDDIAIGVDIRRVNSHNHNDLDVVFTHNNRLYCIECKTGVGRRALYHQIIYKACAIKESLLGLRSNFYVFSLNHDHNDSLLLTAGNMGIVYLDISYAQNPARLRSLIEAQ